MRQIFMSERLRYTPVEASRDGAIPVSGEAMDFYLADIRHFPLTTPEEQVKLLQRAQAGDSAANETLVGSNAGLPIHIAKDFRGRGVAFPDLVQEGNMALLRATKLFDTERGEAKFSTYAATAIRRRLRNVVRKEHGLEESIDDTDKGLRRRLSSTAFPNPEAEALRADLRRRIVELIRSLPPREAEIIELKYGLNGYDEHTFEEIGQKLDVSRQRVHQIISEALAKLRSPERAETVRDYV